MVTSLGTVGVQEKLEKEIKQLRQAAMKKGQLRATDQEVSSPRVVPRVLLLSDDDMAGARRTGKIEEGRAEAAKRQGSP